eukprot:gene5163-biopygen3841
MPTDSGRDRLLVLLLLVALLVVLLLLVALLVVLLLLVALLVVLLLLVALLVRAWRIVTAPCLDSNAVMCAIKTSFVTSPQVANAPE